MYSDYSNETSIYVPAVLPPPSTPSLSISGGVQTDMTSNFGIGLSWTNVSDETGYEVWYSADGSNFSKIATLDANVTTYNENKSPVTQDITHYYKVRAFNGNGYSGFSSVKSIAVAAATSVSGSVVRGEGSNWYVTLNWSDNSSINTGYEFCTCSHEGVYGDYYTQYYPGANATTYTLQGSLPYSGFEYLMIKTRVGGVVHNYATVHVPMS